MDIFSLAWVCSPIALLLYIYYLVSTGDFHYRSGYALRLSLTLHTLHFGTVFGAFFKINRLNHFEKTNVMRMKCPAHVSSSTALPFIFRTLLLFALAIFAKPASGQYVVSSPGACFCRDDASVNGNNGTFRDTVRVTGAGGAMLASGQSWQVFAVSGAYQPDLTAAPGPSGLPVVTGTALSYDAVTGHYRIPFEHVDAQGYSITIEGPFAAGTPGNIFLSLSNTCFYPSVTLLAPVNICSNSGTFQIQVQGVDPSTNQVATTNRFDTDSDPSTPEGVSWLNGSTGQVNPLAADFPGPGNVTVYYHYEAPAAQGTSSPGCLKTVSITIQVASASGLSAAFSTSPNPAVVCRDSTVTLTPVNNGGVFSGLFVTDNGLGTGGAFRVDSVGIFAVTYTLIANTGCTNVFSALIQVVDPPARVSGPQMFMLECGATPVAAATSVAGLNAQGISVTDSCMTTGAITLYTVTSSDVDNGHSVCPDDAIRTVTRTYTVEDYWGNLTSFVQTFVWKEDTTKPVFATRPAALVVECDGSGNTAALATWLADRGGARARDVNGCTADSTLLVWSHNLQWEDNRCGNTTRYLYSFTVRDTCGNMATDTASFIIQDTQAPIISQLAQDTMVVCTNGSIYSNQFMDWLTNNGRAVASDVCGAFAWTNNFNFDMANRQCLGGFVQVVFTATDVCGNLVRDTAVITIKGLDYGDLPDNGDNGRYPTTFEHNGARHAVMPIGPNVYFLGNTPLDTVDTEPDGIPGAMANGDGSDESGVQFLTPLIPGTQAIVRFRAVNNLGAPATIYGFADFDGNGVLDPLVFGTVPQVAAMSTIFQNYTFTVPSTGIGNSGAVYFRFRISTDNAAQNATGFAADGEVEDYMVNVFSAGNLVWEDRNHNGLQDASEINLGIAGATVIMRFAGIRTDGTFDEMDPTIPLDPLAIPTAPSGTAGDLVKDTLFVTTTDAVGKYLFSGLVEGKYQFYALDPSGLTPTRANYIKHVSDEDMDSDGAMAYLPWSASFNNPAQIRHTRSQVVTFLTGQIGTDEEGILDQGNPLLPDPNEVGLYPDARVEQRIDFGYIAFDFGDLDTSYITLEDSVGIGVNLGGLFPTATRQVGNPAEGPKHIVTPDLYMGTCSDAEPEGQPDDDAGQEFASADGRGDDPNNSAWDSDKPANTCTDDDNGVRFVTPLVPGHEAIITLDFWAKVNDNGPDAYLQAFFDWNGDGDFYVNGNPALGFDANEHIVFTKLNGAAAPLEPNTRALKLEMSQKLVQSPLRLAFNVPSNAQYFDGNFLTRFRIGLEPNMAPTGILPANINFPDGIVPYGEVEDYFMKLVQLGNLVWEDRNYNGKQDLNEPVIAGVPVRLDFHGATTALDGDEFEKTYRDTTDANGTYYFYGLLGANDPSGNATPTYTFTISDPAGLTPVMDSMAIASGALSNCVRNNSDGNDDNIDDRITTVTFSLGNPMGQCTGEAHPAGRADSTTLRFVTGGVNNLDNIWPDNQLDETFDFGYVSFDYGDLPDATLGAPYNYPVKRDWLPTLPIEFGPRHAIQPRLYLGQGVDGELDGRPDVDAGSAGGGDDDDAGAFVKGTASDDETGIRLLTPLIPNEIAYIQVAYTSQDTVLAGGYADVPAFLNTFIDFNGDGDLYDAGEKITFTHLGTGLGAMTDIADTDNPSLPGGSNLTRVLAFQVPGTATYLNGVAFMRFRLSWEGNLAADNNAFHQTAAPHVVAGVVTGATPYPRGEVEDYAIPLAKIGNLAWYDHNVNGNQDDPLTALYNTYRDEYGVDTLHLVLIWGGLDPSTGTLDAVGYQDAAMASAGTVTDIQYNLTLAPPTGNYTPATIVRTSSLGLYSFSGLIPGNYHLIPRKYLQADSTAFVNFWPRHRVLTLKNNPVTTDSTDSDAGPGAVFTLADRNPRNPEVSAGGQPLGENGQQDASDTAAPLFADSLWNKTIDFGWVDEPNVEANLDIVGVYFPSSNICGNFNVIMHLGIKNPTEVPLDSLQGLLNLRTAYGNAFYAASRPKVSIADSAYILGPARGKYKKSMAGAKAALVPNPNYNGETDIRLLLPATESAGFYLPGDSVVYIRIEFEVNPTGTSAYPWMSQAVATARAVGFRYENGGAGRIKIPLINQFPKSPGFGVPIVVRDSSDEIDDPMVGSDMIAFEGAVSDRNYSSTAVDKYVDENDKIVQNDDCWNLTKWNGGVRNVNITLDASCQAIVNADILLPNFIPACGFDKYPEGSYYAVIITDKHTQRTVWTSDDSGPFDVRAYLGRHLTYEVLSVANNCRPIWGDLTFEDKTSPVVTCPANTDKKVGGAFVFACTDVDSVLNVSRSWSDTSYAYFTGRAFALDNCTEVFLERVSDFLIPSTDCAGQTTATAVIERTFYFRDLAGNSSNCKQLIYFRRPVIVLPDCKIEVPSHLARTDTVLSPTDLVARYGLAESVPYYLNGAGRRVYLFDRDICGFAVRYTDKHDFQTGQCGRKIVRSWAIMDWCYGAVSPYPDYLRVSHPDSSCYSLPRVWSNREFKWQQFIVVGDETAPVVRTLDSDKDGFRGTGYPDSVSINPLADNLVLNYDAGDFLEFSTGPMDCTGSFQFDRRHFTVEEENDWCYDIQVLRRSAILDQFKRPTGQFSWTLDGSVRVSGNCQNGFLIGGVPMPVNDLSSYFIRLTVTNTCSGRTTILIPIRAVDKVAPVMKCTDRLTVSFDNVGYGAVTVKSVDVGSTDNCSKLAWSKIRRVIPVGSCRSNWADAKNYVDANRNGLVDAGDYIDENLNLRKDTLEVFVTSTLNGGALMSPLLDTLPMYCCDGDSVMVELWGEDKAGNRNFCWNWVRLEDKTTVDFLLPFNQTYTCKDQRPRVALLSKAGTYAEGSAEYAASVALFKEDVILLRGHLCSPVLKEIVVVPDMRCDAGTISISWRLTKTSSKGPVLYTTPARTLTILPVNEYNLMFPADVTGNCADLRDTANVVDAGELGCDILAVLVQDTRYDGATQDGRPLAECYKIFRTFTVINWCQYSESCLEPMKWAVVVPRDVPGRPGTGSFNGVNVLVRDPDAMNPAALPKYYFEDAAGTVPYPGARVEEKERANAGDKVAQAGEEVTSFLFNGSDPRGNPGCPTPNGLFAWMFTQHIFINDEIAPEVLNDRGSGQGWIGYQNKETCGGEIVIQFTTRDLCSGTDIQQDSSITSLDRVFFNPGRNKSARISVPASSLSLVPRIFAGDENAMAPVRIWSYASSSLSPGLHSISIIARDDCGNLSKELEIPFEIRDTSITAPICLNGLSLSLMPSPGGTGDDRGMVVVWATDFVAGPIYDCNGQGVGVLETDNRGRKLIKNYYVVKDNGDGVWDSRDSINAKGLPLNKRTSVTFNCADTRSAHIRVRVYSEDTQGNMAWCESFATVSDPSKFCTGVMMSSAISGKITTENQLAIEGVEVNLSGNSRMTYMTSATGQFSFGSMEQGYDYTVTPSMDRDFLNGVSTMDIVLITRHILGINPLNSPYKLIAADINNSKSVTTMDLVQLRKLILGMEAKFPSNTSWRFVDASYRFLNPSNPWQIVWPELVSINDLSRDVIANFTAIKIGDVNNTAVATTTPRTAGIFTLYTNEMKLSSGAEYRIPIRADLKDIEGFQFTMGLNQNVVELIDIEHGIMQAEHFGVFQKDGLITTSYNVEGPVAKTSKEAVLFTLVLKVRSGISVLSEVLSINGKITPVEAFNYLGELQKVSLAFTAPFPAASATTLFQNIPNPFAGETLIGFYLAQAGEAVLTVSDIQGRVLKVIRGNYGVGYQQVRLRSDGLPAGVLQYTLSSGDFTSTRRMVVGN